MAKPINRQNRFASVTHSCPRCPPNPANPEPVLKPLNAIQVTDADEAKAMLMSVMDNQAGAARDIVLLNAGAAIYVAGLSDTLGNGVKRAAEIVASGLAKNKLQQLVQTSNAS